MTRGKMMKKIFIMGVVAAGLLTGFNAFAQHETGGTQDSKILARERRLKQSQVIQEVAQTYREMVSSYKAQRIERAEEMSRKLTELIHDPLLPEAFAQKMAVKQERFLDRIYGEGKAPKIDIPVDDVSAEEIVQIQTAMQEQASNVQPVIQDADVAMPEPVVDHSRADKIAAKKAFRVERLAEKKRLREQKIARAQERRQRRRAARQKKREERLARLAEKKKRGRKDDDSPAPEGPSVSVNEEIAKIRETERRLVMEKKLTEFQDEAEESRKDMESQEDEIERYVRLYKEEMGREKKELEEEFGKRIENLYQDGIEFYNQKAYRFSLDVFNEMEKISPNYKETRAYLAELKRYFLLQRTMMSRPSLQDPQRQQVISNALDEHLP